MSISRYHKFLRVALIVTTIVLIFDSGIVTPVSKQLSDTTFLYLASVGSGIYASVPPNEVNTLSAQLREQKKILDDREAMLHEREIATRNFDSETKDYSTYIISIILFILTTLITLNYILDFNRIRSAQYSTTSVQ